MNDTGAAEIENEQGLGKMNGWSSAFCGVWRIFSVLGKLGTEGRSAPHLTSPHAISSTKNSTAPAKEGRLTNSNLVQLIFTALYNEFFIAAGTEIS
jgi:hypothetical protein